MNLNEDVFNKPKTKFITTGKCVEENRIDIRNASPSTNSRIYFHKQKSKQKRHDNQTSANWGSACISVQPSTSSRKSSNTNTTNEAQTRTIIALTEGRGQARCEVGMACLSISSPVLVICQISDTQDYFNTLTKINILNPTEILFPNTFEKFSSRLITKIKEKFPKLKYTAMVRSAFNKTNGLDILSKLCIFPLDGILLVLRHRYYALAASSALLTFLQDNLYIFYAEKSLKIEYQESEGFTLIDIATADRLELVCCAKPAQGNKYSSLLGILDNCQTKVGSRMLRSWILQPPFNVEYIKGRLECVDEIITNRVLLTSLQGFLQKLSNVDSLLSLATLVPQDPQKCTVRQLNYILNINGFVDLVNPLKDLLANFKQYFFVKLRETLDDSGFKEIRDMLRENINEDAQSCKGEAGILSRCYAIKPGVSGLLDVVRKIYSERVNDMKEYVELLADKYNLALSLNNNQKKGYHIILTMNKEQKKSFKKSDLPPEFIEVQRTATYITMKTPELINISVRVDDILEDILKISNVIVYNIVINLRKHITLFYTLCEEVARLDVYLSLAQTSLENNYIRPEFGTYTEIKFGSHPLLNFLLPTKPVANSIFCSDDYNVHIITGPNGSGKSIFIRQMMLLQIMAQLGSHVPAEYAVFKPVQKMFARVCLDDNMEEKESSFMLEMKEIKYIMSTMTNDSLIIIDELGRSTSVDEGKSIAIAILEQMSCFSSLILVATHFMLLAKLNLMYPHIKTWQMETIPNGDDPKTFQLDYKYRLIPGITTVPRYGVYLIRNFWPDSIVKYVDDALDQFEERQQKQLLIPMDPKIELKYSTESQLRQLKRQNLLTTSKINEIILKYQLDLRNLKGNNENVTTSVIEAYNNNQLREIENFGKDFLAQQKRFEEILTPIIDQQDKEFNNSDSVSETSEFINMLCPVVTINEIPSSSIAKITSDTSNHSFTGNSDRTDSPSVLNDSANQVDDQNVTQTYQNDFRRYESFAEPNTYKYYISPEVHIIEGLNDSTISENGFTDFKNHFSSFPKKTSTPGNGCFNLSKPNSSLRNAEITSNINSWGVCNPDETSTATLISQMSYEKANEFSSFNAIASREIAQTEENETINQSSINHVSEGDISKSQKKCSPFGENFIVIDEVQTTFNYDTSECANLNKNCQENLLNTTLYAISNQKSITANQNDNKDADEDWNEIPENEDIANQTCLEALISFEQNESLSETRDTSSGIPNTGNKQFLLRTNNCKKPSHVSIPNLDLNSSNNKLSSVSHVTPSMKQSNMFETSASKKLNKNKELPYASIERSSLEIEISRTSKKRHLDITSDPNSKSRNKNRDVSAEHFALETSVSNASKNRNLNASDPGSLLPGNHDLPPASEKLDLASKSLNNGQLIPVTIIHNGSKTSVPDSLVINQDLFQASVENSLFETSISSTSKKRNLNDVSDSDSMSINKGLHLCHVSNEALLLESNIFKTASYPDMSRASPETSISSASKKHNPNSVSDSGSKFFNKDLVLSHASNEIIPPETSISSASRKRRLDVTSDPDMVVSGNQDLSQASVEHCSRQTSISSTSKKRHLNSASDSGSKSINKGLHLSHVSNEILPPETSISSTSRQRRLDVASDPDLSVPVERCSLETSMSSVSKKRNLNSASDSGPKSLNKDLVLSHASNEILSPETSISSASRQRRLDVESDPEIYVDHSFPEGNTFSVSKIGSAPKSINENLSFASDGETRIESDSKKRYLDCASDPNTKIAKNILSSSSNDHSVLKTNESRTPKKRRIAYFSYPASKSHKHNEPTVSNKHKPIYDTNISKPASNESRKINKIQSKTKTNFKKFVPPKQLTTKQIKKDFEEQDKEIFASSPTSSNISKYLESRRTRPTAQQIRDTTYCGTFKRNEHGLVQWLPPDSSVKQRKRKQESRTFSNQSIDMTIFSDRNAAAFEQFINSKERDFRKIQSNGQNKTVYFDHKNENIFDFYMTNCQNEKPGPSNANFKLPREFLENNKDDKEDDPRINIFESPYLSEDDLEL